MTQATQGGPGVERSALPAQRRMGRAAIMRSVAAFLLYEVAFYLAYSYGMSFSQVTASPFWFPDSVLLCALLLTPARWWWVFLLGALPIRLMLPGLSGIPLWFLLAAFVIDSAKGLVTAWALRRLLPDPLHLRTVHDFAMYCLIAVVLVPAAAALGGAGARLLLGHEFWPSWQQWMLGNVLTHLVVTPAILWGIPGAARAFAGSRPSRWIEGLCVASGIVVAVYFAFQTPTGDSGLAEPRFYAPVPFLFWAALRFGMFGASAAAIILSIFAVAAALGGHGPFAGNSPNEIALALQQFLFLSVAPLYVVAILFEEKRVAEDRLIESERRYREVVDSQTEMVCRFLPDGTLSFVNEAFCRAFRSNRAQLVGTDFIALLSAAEREAARAQIDRAAERGERGEWECAVALPDGSIGWQHWLCHPIVAPSAKLEEFQAIGHDITDRKRAEEAKVQADKDRYALAHLARVSMMGQLSAAIAHQLNQPLAAMVGNAEAARQMLGMEPLDRVELKEICNDVVTEGHRAADVIRRLGALYKRGEMKLAPLDLNELVRETLELVRAELLNRHVVAHTELSPVMPEISGGRVQLQQVLLNLILNAADAMSEIDVTARRVVVRTELDDADVRLMVIDCGTGIAPADLESVFEPFWSTKEGGIGVGLAICHSIVTAHNGTLTVANNAEGGATFCVTWPAQQPS